MWADNFLRLTLNPPHRGIYKNPLLVSEVSLPEVTFLLNRAVGILAVAPFMKALITVQPRLQTLTWNDLARAQTILLTYASAKFDLVDCCIMALSERLNIEQVATFDRRDFSIFHPKQCDCLELLPEWAVQGQIPICLNSHTPPKTRSRIAPGCSFARFSPFTQAGLELEAIYDKLAA